MSTQLTTGKNGFPCYRVSTPAGEAEIYRYGAQITHWQPRGHQPVLYLCKQTFFQAGKAIRGGVPVCFPWFGPRQGAPSHGWARLQEWQIEPGNDGVTCRLVQDGFEVT